jgi:hypothetical protein
MPDRQLTPDQAAELAALRYAITAMRRNVNETLDALDAMASRLLPEEANERSDKIKQLKSYKGVIDAVNSGKFF